jgi:hypothetical protein
MVHVVSCFTYSYHEPYSDPYITRSHPQMRITSSLLASAVDVDYAQLEGGR